jgi:hypothetical protein
LEHELDFARLVEALLTTPLVVYPHIGGTAIYHATLRMEIDQAADLNCKAIVSAAVDGSSLFTDEKLFAMYHQIFLVSPVLDRLRPPTLTSVFRTLSLLKRGAQGGQWYFPPSSSTPHYRRTSWLDTLAAGTCLTGPKLMQTLHQPVKQLHMGHCSDGHVVWSTSQTTVLREIYLKVGRHERYCNPSFEFAIHEYYSAPRLPFESTVLYKPMAIDGILPGFDAFLVDKTSKTAIVYRITTASSRKLTSADLERFKTWGIPSIHFIALVEGPGPHTVYLPEDDSFIATKGYMPL